VKTKKKMVSLKPEREKHDLEARIEMLSLTDWAAAFAVFNLLTAELVTKAGSGEALVAANLTDWLKEKVKGGARNWFLEWWLAYLEAMCAYDMLDGWITSPHHTAGDDEVRSHTRDQVTALTKKAKEKLAERLHERAKELRERAKRLRDEGKADKASRTERQATEFDVAAEEVELQAK
jgi:hypothetical protein